MLTAAALLSLAMRCAPAVHPDTISDVAHTESRFNPYAIAEIVPVKGKKSRVISYMPSSKNEAMNIISAIQKRKHRYSVGVMQITNTNFPKLKVTAKDMLNPCSNISVSEKILIDCYKRGGSLLRMLSCYYSGNFNTGQKKETAFGNTSYVQRIGYKTDTRYIVPSTREDRKALSESKPAAPVTIWPDSIARGEIIASPPPPEANYPTQVIRGVFISTEKKKS